MELAAFVACVEVSGEVTNIGGWAGGVGLRGKWLLVLPPVVALV